MNVTATAENIFGNSDIVLNSADTFFIAITQSDEHPCDPEGYDCVVYKAEGEDQFRVVQASNPYTPFPDTCSAASWGVNVVAVHR